MRPLTLRILFGHVRKVWLMLEVRQWRPHTKKASIPITLFIEVFLLKKRFFWGYNSREFYRQQVFTWGLVSLNCKVPSHFSLYKHRSLYFFSFQILTSVRPTSITVMPMLSVITLRDLITAHAALDILEMDCHARVNHQAKKSIKNDYILRSGTFIYDTNTNGNNNNFNNNNIFCIYFYYYCGHISF